MAMRWQVGLYVAALALPLCAFLIQVVAGRWLGRRGDVVGTAAVGLTFVLSLVGAADYFLVESGAGVPSGAVSQQGVRSLGRGPRGAAAAPAREAATTADPLAWRGGVDWVAVGTGLGGDRGPAPRSIRLALHVDNLAVLMFLMVSFVATAVHVYSTEYLRGDPRYARYFAYLSLFGFAMLGLVAAADLIVLFVCWELVGVCSYLLIGLHFEEATNANAATKAFLVNRVGDVGLLVGIGLLWSALGTTDIAAVNRALRDGGGGLAPWLVVLAGLGVFLGCVGKSAQFPLHVWLPDAMAGPTPASALIHAATMVAAGVYLVGRLYPLFTDGVLLVIAYTGGLTLLFGAGVAAVQTDYKRVLAYSTVSQLGFMMLGLGVGGWAAGLFHLLTHGCFKALLFLGAGSVYRATHTYEMPALGGLGRKMPWTAGTMLVATLAIAGVPFFSGFYSKDAILAAALTRVFVVPGGRAHLLLFLMPALGTALTAFYMLRMWFLVFAGEPRGFPDRIDPEGRDGSHHGVHPLSDPYETAEECPPRMRWPLVALAVPSVFLGWTVWAGVPVGEPVLERLLAVGEPVRGDDRAASHYLALAASVLVATAGVGGGVAFYAPPMRYLFRRRFRADLAAAQLPGVYRFFRHKWYIDEFYHAAVLRPTLALARWLGWFDRRALDGLVDGSATAVRGLSRLEGWFDLSAVDGLVRLAAAGVYQAGDQGRRLQTGRLRHYLMVLAAGLVGLAAGVFLWVRR